MHGRAYRGRTATVRCGPLKVLWEREVGWPWLRAPASLSASEGDPPRHTGVCSGPLPPRRDHHGPSPYGDAARGSAGAGEGHGTRPRAWTTRPRLVWFSKVVKVKCAAFSFPAYGILSLASSQDSHRQGLLFARLGCHSDTKNSHTNTDTNTQIHTHKVLPSAAWLS